VAKSQKKARGEKAKNRLTVVNSNVNHRVPGGQESASARAPRSQTVYEGRTIRIEAVVQGGGGACPASEFIRSLGARDQQRLRLLFEAYDESKRTGKYLSKEKFRQLEGSDLYEFKYGRVRLLCFLVQSGVVLTHGCMKDQPTLPLKEVRRAEALKRTYEARRESTHG
jgi:hypothetical protein